MRFFLPTTPINGLALFARLLAACGFLLHSPVAAQTQSPPAPSNTATTLELPAVRAQNAMDPKARALEAYLKSDPAALETTGGAAGPPSLALRSFLLAFPSEKAGRADRVVANALPRLELKGGSTLLTDAQRRELANQLRTVLTTLPLPRPEDLDRRATGADFVVVTTSTVGAVKLRLNESGIWVFPDETVQLLPQFLNAIQSSEPPKPAAITDAKALIHQSARTVLPEWARKVHGGAAIWQWAALAFGLFGVMPLAHKVIRQILRRVILFILGRYRYHPANETLSPTVGSAALIATSYLGFKGLSALGMPPFVTGTLTYLFLVTGLWGALGTIWFGLEAIGRAILKRREAGVGGATDEILINFLIRAAKILLLLIGLAITGNALGFNITALLAGLGLGGVAIALAAKNTIENLLGTITLLVDRPFRIGDRIKVNAIEGVVTRVGLRSTRISTLTESAITLPNHTFIASTIENFGPVPRRLWQTTLMLSPANPPDRLKRFTDEAKALLKSHGNVVPDSVNVSLNDIGPRSISLLLSARIRALDYAAELAARQDLVLGISHLVAAHQIDIAPPGT